MKSFVNILQIYTKYYFEILLSVYLSKFLSPHFFILYTIKRNTDWNAKDRPRSISSEYVTVDFICMGLLGLQGAKTENNKMKNSCPYRDSNSRPLILKSSALSIWPSNLIYKRQFKTYRVEYRCSLYYL